MGKIRKRVYTILDIVNAERLAEIIYDYGSYNHKTHKYERFDTKTFIFKSEEDAYKHLFRQHFSNYMSNERSLQILLLVSELSKTDEDIAYKIFLTEDKKVKTFNHMTVIAYLKENKMFKQAFKAYCDMVAVMGLGKRGKNGKVCFEHFEIEEHPAGTDISKL